jgi:tetratricopeptide (TPR) repeat protein
MIRIVHMKDLCFVVMPFGKKPDIAGIVDFDAVYRDLIAPAIVAAGLEPLRADHESGGGVIHKAMFERLILCRFAVGDLTSANANVAYELGVRHAVRPRTTVLIFAQGRGQLPFDLNLLRAMPYSLDKAGVPENAENERQVLTKALIAAKEAAVKEKEGGDSPIRVLVHDFPFPEIEHLKTDSFQQYVADSDDRHRKIAEAKKNGVSALLAFEQSLENIEYADVGVLLDLFLTYRGVKAWDAMIDLVRRMPAPLAESVMVQEQLALALNRAGRGDEAEKVLLDLIDRRGPSSETYGILGRVYKDRWEAASKADEMMLARGLLEKAIAAYRKGFEADWRDAYPGINAVTLMELKQPPDPKREELLPLVRYAAIRRVAAGQPDFWDYATLLEAAVLLRNEEEAFDALGNALPLVRASWEPESTARNLRLIAEARKKRNEELPWVNTVRSELDKAAARHAPKS